MKVSAWTVHTGGEPMVLEERDEQPGPEEVLVEVAGCGVCHTDLGFYYDGVPTRHGFPLTLGHEVSGTVVEAGRARRSGSGKQVVVPAVTPCGKCEACLSGHGRICPKQIFPGSDVHGGFASHLRIPAVGLCPVPDLSDDAREPPRDHPSCALGDRRRRVHILPGHRPKRIGKRAIWRSSSARGAWAASASRSPRPWGPTSWPSMSVRSGWP